MITKATDYSNLYRAKVVSNYDPKELCRIKARIPCIHGVSEVDGISDDAIPYASPCFLDVSFDSGTFLVPEVGSTVFVFFESGESTKPIYFGSSVSYQYEDEAQYLGDKNSYNFQGTDGKRMKRAGFGDTPFNVYKKGILRKLILFKSRKGSSIEFCDEDENEHISIYDRVGQVLTMYSPIKIRDNDVMCSTDIVDKLRQIAKDAKIKYQDEILTFGGTDTSSMQVTGKGARVSAVSIPTAFLHTGVEMIDMADVKEALKLTIALCNKL
jgi:hypothetical protein